MSYTYYTCMETHCTIHGGMGGRRPPSPPSTVLRLTLQCTGGRLGLLPPCSASRLGKQGLASLSATRGGTPTGGRQQKRPPSSSLALAVEIKKRACCLAAGEIGILSSIFLLLLRAFLCLSRIRGKKVGKYEFSVSRSVHTVC